MNKFINLLLITLYLSSCKDLYELDMPHLNVWTDSNVYSVGDTVVFHIDANANFINFYSGESGKSYEYYNKDRVYEMIPSLTFRAAKYAGNNEDCAKLLYTTDFNGDYSFENVKNANWIDISNRFTIPPIVGTSPTFSDAGKADISDLVEKGKPLYFAWHCKTNESSQRTRFQVTDFSVIGEVPQSPDLSGILYSQAELAFTWSLNEAAATQTSNLPNITNSLIYWDGIFNNLDGPLKEGYAVSGPVVISDSINLGKDYPLPIKSVQTENMTKYFYRYEKAGTYEVVFVAFNANFTGSREVVKKITLNIIEQ